MLTDEMRQNWRAISADNLWLTDDNEEEFYKCIVTGMRCGFTTMTLRISETACSGSTSVLPLLVALKVTAPAGKIICTIFWDAEGVLLIDNMPHKATINGFYYTNLLQKLQEAIKQTRRGKLSGVQLLLHDNTPAHRSQGG